MTNYTKKTISGISIVFVFYLFAALFAYFFRLLLSRNLSLTDFGLFFSLFAFASIFYTIRDFGVFQSTYYFIPRFLATGNNQKIKAVLSKVFKISILMTLLISFLIILLSKYLALNYFHIADNNIIILFFIGFIFNAFEMSFMTLFNVFQSQILFSAHNFFRSFLIFILTFISFKYFTGIYVPLVCGIIVYFVILVISSIIFFKKVFPQFFKVKESYFNYNKLIKFGIPATLAVLGFNILTSIDTIILTYFRSLEDVGLYNAVLPIITLLLYLPNAISAVMYPMSIELWAKKKLDTLNYAIERITKYTLIILIPASGILLIYPEITLNVLFGAKFIPAQNALMILAFGAVFLGISTINTHILSGILGPKINIYIFLFGAILNIVINLLLVPKYGIVGSALGTSITYFFIFIISSYLLYSTIKLKFRIFEILKIVFIGALIIYLISYLKSVINLSVYMELIIVLLLATIGYIFLLFLFRIISLQEFKDIFKQISTKD